ncbi:POLG alternative reading frame-like [Equus asinus]|uniref:POLG alternative reading frame-like n=1 Tax=Equus asinus TaxID=9793 RepID=UPI0038F7E9EC
MRGQAFARAAAAAAPPPPAQTPSAGDRLGARGASGEPAAAPGVQRPPAAERGLGRRAPGPLSSQKHRGRRGPRAPIAGRPAPVRPSPGIGCPARAASPVSAPRARRRPLSLADQGGRSRGYLVAGSGPGRACGGESHSGPTSGLRRLCAASAGCSGLSSERRLKTTGTAIEAGMLWYWYFH